MKRPIITVDDINAASRDKKTELTVPYNCAVTPAARDMAVSLGITVNREPCAGRGSVPKAKVTGAVGAGPVGPGGVAGAHDVAGLPEAGSNCRSTADQDKLTAEIRAKVLAQLPTSLHDSAVVDQLIRKHLGASGCTCDSCRPVATGRPASAPAAATAPCVEDWKSVAPGENAALGALHIHSAKLPWKNFSGGGPAGAVHIIDAITAADGAPFAVGYMEWEDTSFPWKLDYAEVCIVLQGQLCITLGGQCLKGGVGDALYLPKGAEVEFSASGYVKFAYVIWPADWAAK